MIKLFPILVFFVGYRTFLIYKVGYYLLST